MFCPKCGREQAINMRFCSGCGFQLEGTSQLLATDGMLPMVPNVTPQNLPFAEKKPKPRGTKIGVILMLISAVISPIFLAGAIAADHPAPLIIPFTMFLAGFATLIYSLIFKDSTPQPLPPQRRQPMSPMHPVRPVPPSALPQPEAHRIDNFHKPLNTSEIVNTPSITEGTTQLFDKERQ
ncbi:MAG: zinc ribbon domain-containing protein [Acidobacteriota bacterium]